MIFVFNNSEVKPNYKIGVIGDLHGKDLWIDIIRSMPDVNRWVFLGDYVDSFTFTGEQIILNLKRIIELKKADPTGVILLLGNHDIQYLFYPKYRCTGFRAEMAEALRIIFTENADLFQLAHSEGNHLFTHAGVSEAWHNKNAGVNFLKGSVSDIADHINMGLYLSSIREPIMQIGDSRNKYPSGNDIPGGPLWADLSETMNGLPTGIHQVVGHTKTDNIRFVMKNQGSSISYCDTFDHDANHIEWLVIEFERRWTIIRPIRQVTHTIEKPQPKTQQ